MPAIFNAARSMPAAFKIQNYYLNIFHYVLYVNHFQIYNDERITHSA